jgi:hypothetical protein
VNWKTVSGEINGRCAKETTDAKQLAFDKRLSHRTKDLERDVQTILNGVRDFVVHYHVHFQIGIEFRELRQQDAELSSESGKHLDP